MPTKDLIFRADEIINELGAYTRAILGALRELELENNELHDVLLDEIVTAWIWNAQNGFTHLKPFPALRAYVEQRRGVTVVF